jgi:hypothetical protein
MSGRILGLRLSRNFEFFLENDEFSCYKTGYENRGRQCSAEHGLDQEHGTFYTFACYGHQIN